MATQVLCVPAAHPLNRINESLKAAFVAAQSSMVEMEFPNAWELCARAFSDLKIALRPPVKLRGEAVGVLGDSSSKELHAFFSKVLTKNGVPEQAISLQAANLCHRTQLLRAFAKPDAVIQDTCAKVSEVVRGFPATADDLRCGRNPGDVLDPYILGAAQQLMYAGDFEGTVSATVAHKVLMMIEGLLGHLHEDVLGAIRGNVRAPEPRGKDQETLDPELNPFPGADIVQPPLASGRPLRFHQVKSKTGSAKGGDGRRLGLQLSDLQKLYGGDIY